ncbi:MAG TPA: hypothetical protein VGC41_28035, partial [Kofleriaceae bacterium]
AADQKKPHRDDVDEEPFAMPDMAQVRQQSVQACKSMFAQDNVDALIPPAYQLMCACVIGDAKRVAAIAPKVPESIKLGARPICTSAGIKL